MTALEHGGGLDQAMQTYGGDRGDWLDLSTGINPNPYPVPAIRPDAWQRLPDRDDEAALLRIAREYYRVKDKQEIVAAPGTQAIIQALPFEFVQSKVGVLSPTYNEHAGCWARAGHSVVELGSFDQLADCDIAIIVNPNNPTCEIFEPSALIELAGKVETLIVDEAFCDLTPDHSLVPTCPDNVIILRSFGKFFGLAGIRLGFAICDQKIANGLRSRLGPWAVSGPALQIGAAALADEAWHDETRQWLRDISAKQSDLIAEFGLEVSGCLPLFIDVRLKSAEKLFEHLASSQILVRKFSGRPEYLRFGICGNDSELVRLKQALAYYEASGD